MQCQAVFGAPHNDSFAETRNVREVRNKLFFCENDVCFRPMMNRLSPMRLLHCTWTVTRLHCTRMTVTGSGRGDPEEAGLRAQAGGEGFSDA